MVASRKRTRKACLNCNFFINIIFSAHKIADKIAIIKQIITVFSLSPKKSKKQSIRIRNTLPIPDRSNE